MNRREALDNLREEDPDYVVDVLRISSAELIGAFPEKVQIFLEEECDDGDATGDQ